MTSLDLPVRPLAPLPELHLGAGLQAATRSHGGDISGTSQLRTTHADFVLNTTRLTQPDLSPAEAQGLSLRRAADPLPVPDVVAPDHDTMRRGLADLRASWCPARPARAGRRGYARPPLRAAAAT
ncbi:hypothetical protein LAJ19_09850 [Deinococcus taeanensis]|uniref:hypothetical protein n=1 Tax=Deinococcus taeanensis TaxID=2737050 RepID=UPI001CDC773D|nr:hypothetical protein [Deinococcus taeanensis]UBV41942.1 hypothetical protein LAJ19_09850 [Deinococcus taeanensis]